MTFTRESREKSEVSSREAWLLGWALCPLSGAQLGRSIEAPTVGGRFLG